MSSRAMGLGHKWSVTFHYFGLSCDILRQDAKQYLLALCHVRLVTWFLVALDTLNWHPSWFIGFPFFHSIVSNWWSPILSAWFSAELDVTLVAFRSSGSLGLSERWMIVRMDEFSIGINQSKNNSSNIDNSINSCFQISHDSYTLQLQKEQYWIVTHIFCSEVQRKGWIYHTCFKIWQFRLILYLVITTKMTSGSF